MTAGRWAAGTDREPFTRSMISRVDLSQMWP